MGRTVIVIITITAIINVIIIIIFIICDVTFYVNDVNSVKYFTFWAVNLRAA